MDFKIEGHEQLNRKLSMLRTSVQRRVLTSAVRAGLVVGARYVRNATPGNLKHARKSVGQRFSKQTRGSLKGVRLGKVGYSVGKNRTRQRQLQQQAAASRPEKRPGVGISGRNVHWILLGTSKRKQKSTGRSTGRMPKATIDPIATGLRAGDLAIRQAMKKRLGAGLAREIAKLRLGKK